MRLLVLACLLAACGSGESPACAGLSLVDCRVEPGCQLDTCAGCDCSPGFRGCISLAQVPAPCPELGCPSPFCCNDEADCTAFPSACAPPGTAQGCGACNTEPGTCGDDAGCVGIAICEPIPCSCDGNRECVPGCTDDTTCVAGTTCDLASNRCVAKACAGEDQCPPNFDCRDGACARVPCTTDLDCDGFCVEGACFDSLGECRPPAA